MYNDKVPLLLLSGGLDSTYLLYNLLKTTDVDVLYINGNQNPDKITMELLAIDKIISWFSVKNKHNEFQEIKYSIRNFYKVDANTSDLEYMGFAQPLSWMFGAIAKYNPNVHSSVKIAYVSGDQISSSLFYLKTAWENLTNVIKTKSIPLEFPLETINKRFILKNIPIPLLKLIWFCELPVKKKRNKYFSACNQCGPCVRHQLELYGISKFPNIKEN